MAMLLKQVEHAPQVKRTVTPKEHPLTGEAADTHRAPKGDAPTAEAPDMMHGAKKKRVKAEKARTVLEQESTTPAEAAKAIRKHLKAAHKKAALKKHAESKKQVKATPKLKATSRADLIKMLVQKHKKHYKKMAEKSWDEKMAEK